MRSSRLRDTDGTVYDPETGERITVEAVDREIDRAIANGVTGAGLLPLAFLRKEVEADDV